MNDFSTTDIKQLLDEEARRINNLSFIDKDENAVAASSEEAFFSDEVTLFAIDENHEIINTKKGTLTAYSDRIECCGRNFFYEEMLGLDIFSRNFIVMNYGKDAAHYEMKGSLMFCALKYLYLYKLVKGETL